MDKRGVCHNFKMPVNVIQILLGLKKHLDEGKKEFIL